ncbi:sensor histidine kinase, partial [Paenibacillus zanthoxyli]|uniref:sensor histidine kinase n=1 Tax=Paenibacillus zanthoxyli TaxID=369399 RepID=UPI00046EC0FB
MTKELKLLRYGLIAIPAFISMYVQEYANYDRFTLHLLMLLLLATLGARLPGRFTIGMAALEMLYSSWLCSRYGSLMVFPSLSVLLAYFRLRPGSLPLLLAGIHLAVLNAAVMEEAPVIRAWVSLVFLLAAVLCAQLYSAGRGREETLHLYDELRKKHFELDEARNRLLQFASQVENAAQAEERIRISRQLHDDIGHRLIRVKMMMEAALHTLPSAPEAGMSMMRQVRDQLAESMDDLRVAVRRIGRGPHLEGAYALDRLLEETGRDTGIETSYTVEGTPFPLYPSVQVVLYKNAREAITNGLRHGHATSVGIKLCYSPSEVTMEVSNNGKTMEGYGGGMAERSGNSRGDGTPSEQLSGVNQELQERNG